MRTDRIVRRNGLKEKLAELEEITRTSRVIAATQAMLQNVLREGYAKGWEAREDAYNKAEAEAKQVTIDAVNAEIVASNLRNDPGLPVRDASFHVEQEDPQDDRNEAQDH